MPSRSAPRPHQAGAPPPGQQGGGGPGVLAAAGLRWSVSLTFLGWKTLSDYTPRATVWPRRAALEHKRRQEALRSKRSPRPGMTDTEDACEFRLRKSKSLTPQWTEFSPKNSFMTFLLKSTMFCRC